MNTPRIPRLLLAASLAIGATQVATAQRTDAYGLDSAGVVVKTSTGLCLHTSSWTPDKALRECEPARVPAPAAAAPAEPSPPVVATPPAPPPPVAVAPEPPAPAPAARVLVEAVVLKGVKFESNSARLTKDSLPVLDAAAETLLRRPKLSTEVAGHTDDRGGQKLNQALSQKRADAVRDYLVAKGVPAGNLTARGYGEDDPVADNKTVAGRAANRRVELRTR